MEYCLIWAQPDRRQAAPIISELSANERQKQRQLSKHACPLVSAALLGWEFIAAVYSELPAFQISRFLFSRPIVPTNLRSWIAISPLLFPFSTRKRISFH